MKAAPIIGVISGKGGVGKTNIVANVAVAATQRGARVLAVDGDLGLSNLDVLLGLRAERTVAHVLEGQCSLTEAILKSPVGVDVVPAAAGRSDFACLRPNSLARLLVPLFQVAREYDMVLLDAGPGVSPTVISLAMSCDRLLLVTTPEPTSLADAYATLKVLSRERSDIGVEVIVNQARDPREARATHSHLRRVARHFLNVDLPLIACLSKDTRVQDAVKLQQPVVRAFPSARSSKELRRLSDLLLEMRTRSGTGAPVATAMEV